MNTRVFIVNFRGTCFVQNDQALSGYVKPYNFNSKFKYFCSMKRLERLNLSSCISVLHLGLGNSETKNLQ